jgi:hypothetical protein
MVALPILEYREFHDVPRLILVTAAHRFLLLDSPFDSQLDDFSPDYVVYELAADPRLGVGADWRSLPETGTLLGRVQVASVTFDATRRRTVGSEDLERLITSSSADARRG